MYKLKQFSAVDALNPLIVLGYLLFFLSNSASLAVNVLK